MIIDTLPYLIQLIKQNIILQALVASGSTQNIDFKSISCDIFSDGGIQFYNFPLSENEIFDELLFTAYKDSSEGKDSKIISIMLSTRDSKYFDNTEYYFGKFKPEGSKNKLGIGNVYGIPSELGVFRIFDDPIPPAFISIMQNPSYGYGIIILFFADYEERIKRKQALDKAFEIDSSN